MKKHLIYIFLLITSFGCSYYQEDLQKEHLTVEDLSPDKIETSLPIVIITTDEDDFQRMFENPGYDIEIEANVSISRNSGISLNNASAELKIKGNKSAYFELKSLGIKFEQTQTNSQQEIIDVNQVLPFHNLNEIKSIRLRNSGNDFAYSMLKDLCYSDLIIHAQLDLDVMYGEAAHVFVNGAYYGLLNIRTESNPHGISRLYEKKKKDLTMIEVNDPGEIEFKTGDEARIDQLLKDIEDENYDALVDAFDLSNLIDYFIFETYVGNEDWPHTNVRIFAVGNGKFRFVIYDLDKAGNFKIHKAPLYFIEEGIANPIQDLFFVLYDNPNFRAQFNSRYIDLLHSNKINHVVFNTIVDKRMQAIEEDIIYNIEKYSQPAAMLEWYQNIGIIKEVFKKREEIVKEHFGL